MYVCIYIDICMHIFSSVMKFKTSWTAISQTAQQRIVQRQKKKLQLVTEGGMKSQFQLLCSLQDLLRLLC